MDHKVNIGGKPVTLTWDQKASRRYKSRTDEMRVPPKFADLSNPKKADTTLYKLLWAFLPETELSRFPSPESLFVEADPSEFEAICKAIVAILGEMFPNAEKKSTSRKSQSPGSSSASPKKSGRKATRNNAPNT